MKYLTAFALALLTVSAVQAEGTRFGFQATVTKPSGDLGDSKWMDGEYGYGVGLHLLVDLGNGLAVVPRVDYTLYKNDRTVGLFNEDARLKILTGGADVNFYLSRETGKGLYFLGGLGYASGKFESNYTGPLIDLNSDGSKGAFYLQAGAGIQFTPNVGVEVRYQSLDFKDVDTNMLGFSSREDVSCPSIQASLMVRF